MIGIVLILAVVFYGICVIVLPICVFMMSGTLARCLQELKKANAHTDRAQLRHDEIIAGCSKSTGGYNT